MSPTALCRLAGFLRTGQLDLICDSGTRLTPSVGAELIATPSSRRNGDPLPGEHGVLSRTLMRGRTNLWATSRVVRMRSTLRTILGGKEAPDEWVYEDQPEGDRGWR